MGRCGGQRAVATREKSRKGRNGGVGTEKVAEPLPQVARVCSPHSHPALPGKPSLTTGLKEGPSPGVLWPTPLSWSSALIPGYVRSFSARACASVGMDCNYIINPQSYPPSPPSKSIPTLRIRKTRILVSLCVKTQSEPGHFPFLFSVT